MSSRWKGAIAAVAVSGFLVFAFVVVFSGIDLDAGMVVHRLTKKGALWVGMDSNPQKPYWEPLPQFMAPRVFMVGVLWTLVASIMGPVGYLLGYLWERGYSMLHRGR